MADLARSTMRRKMPDLTEALTGHFDDHYAPTRRSAPDAARAHRLRGSCPRRRQRHPDAPVGPPARAAPDDPWGRGRDLAGLISETGADMSRFGSPERLSAWAGLAPGMHESAGKRMPAGSRPGNEWLASMFVEAANSAARCKDTYLAAQFARIASRRGHGRAAGAVAHSMLVSAYWMLELTSPTRTSDPTGSPNATTKRTHAASSPSSNASAIPSFSTPSPDTWNRGNPRRGGSSGLRPDAVAPSCTSFSGQ